jgi:branched-subunit amino acid aminotransferase/4-amino-4-deoxychorismate lyase
MMPDWQRRVAECTGANIFFIQDGKIHTPIADCFLAGSPAPPRLISPGAAASR